MGKRQEWFVTVCLFLFLFLVSQIHCKSHFKGIRRLKSSSNGTTISGINQQSLKEKDLITKLPGLLTTVSFKQYGGYVTVNETHGRFFYYYFVEAINANNSTPLVLWLNGGPGCSSVRGALGGNGPFRIHSDGKTLYNNPYSWNNEANILYVDSPAVVGFSYTKKLFQNEEYSDKVTTEDNYMFLLNWLERFPEFKGREFYISGESYAGHYAPLLAQTILHRKNQISIDLRGIFIGNPSLDNLIKEKGNRQFIAGHALISQELYTKSLNLCAKEDSTNEDDRMRCNGVNDEIDEEISEFNRYNIYAPMCHNDTLTSQPNKDTTVMEYDPCSKNYVKAYFNTKQVQEAIHANTTNIPYPWKSCSDNVKYHWNQDDADVPMGPVLKELMDNNLQVFVYSGDVDAVVSVTSTMMVLKKMNLTVENKWHPWYTEGEVGGYTEDYKGNLRFATVRGAGHSAIIDQPIRAFNLFVSFVRNTPLPDTI